MIAATLLTLSSISIAVASLNSNIPYFNDLSEVKNEGSYRIVNGVPTDILHHPYQAAIYIGKRYSYSGAILNNKWILSTGILLPSPSPFKVAVGISKLSEQAPENRTEVEKFILHPDWTVGTDNCLSLLKLKTSLKFSKNVQKINIASETPKNQSLAVVTGWGPKSSTIRYPSDTLLKANLSIVDNKTCKTAYVASLASNRVICGFNNPTTFAFYDDCGDPLVQDGKLIGIFIDYFNYYGFCLDRSYCPGLFADVTLYKQ